MSETVTATLSEFLLARNAEREAREREEWLPANELETMNSLQRERAIGLWDGMTLTALLRLSITVEDLKIQAIANAPFGHLWLRRRAAKYVDHPDFREEWRP